MNSYRKLKRLTIYCNKKVYQLWIQELAYQYAKRGACLAIIARREDRLREVAERARGCGSPDVLVIKADVSKMDDCKRFVEETVHHFGQLDHLVNNAGVNAIGALEDVSSVDNFRAIMDVNFWGAIYPTYFAIPHLRKTRGKIVVISSSGGWLSVPSLGFYNASKAAIMNFYENLRTELGSDIGITVVTPGFIESEMTQGKYLSEKGKMVHDPVLRDAIIGPIPIMDRGRCSKGIVNGVCRGDRSITQPAWFKMLQYWQVFCPEVAVWVTRTMAGKGTSQRATLNKMMMSDAQGEIPQCLIFSARNVEDCPHLVSAFNAWFRRAARTPMSDNSSDGMS